MTRPALFLVCSFGLMACANSSDPVSIRSTNPNTEFPAPNRDVRRASLELRASLSLGVVDEAWRMALDSFLETELAWLEARQRAHFDVVQALIGSEREAAASDGRIAEILFADLMVWRDMILRNPELDTEIRAGGMPDTLARLLEHSRIRSRTAMAELDTDIRTLEIRLRDPELTANDGQLSLVKTEMIPLHERMIDIHRLRLEFLPWFVQYAQGDRFLELMDDPAILGWLLASEEADDGRP